MKVAWSLTSPWQMHSPHMPKRLSQGTALIHASAVTNVTTEANPQPGTPLAACSTCSKVNSLVLVDSRQR